MSVRTILNRHHLLAGVTLLLAAAATPALAAPAPATARTEHASVQLRADRAVVAPGESLWLAVTLTSIPHWHTYWKNPGDTGLPTRISWTLPEGVHAGPIEWPLPHRLPTPPLMSFGYEGAADLLVRLDVPAGVQGSLPLRAKVNWLVCAEQCVPESAELGLDLPVGRSTPAPDAQALAAIAARLPRPA
ncbi:MAG: hypothetical protein KGI67_15170, partial [Pseudomonadota bacterium]|nr:hypothetical protein [Pseudomonadota bacterium]